MIATFLHPVTRRQFFYYTNSKTFFSPFLYSFTLWHSSCIVRMYMDESGVIFELLLYLHLPQSENDKPKQKRKEATNELYIGLT